MHIKIHNVLYGVADKIIFFEKNTQCLVTINKIIVTCLVYHTL